MLVKQCYSSIHLYLCLVGARLSKSHTSMYYWTKPLYIREAKQASH